MWVRAAIHSSWMVVVGTEGRGRVAKWPFKSDWFCPTRLGFRLGQPFSFGRGEPIGKLCSTLKTSMLMAECGTGVFGHSEYDELRKIYSLGKVLTWEEVPKRQPPFAVKFAQSMVSELFWSRASIPQGLNSLHRWSLSWHFRGLPRVEQWLR